MNKTRHSLCAVRGKKLFWDAYPAICIPNSISSINTWVGEGTWGALNVGTGIEINDGEGTGQMPHHCVHVALWTVREAFWGFRCSLKQYFWFPASLRKLCKLSLTLHEAPLWWVSMGVVWCRGSTSFGGAASQIFALALTRGTSVND